MARIGLFIIWGPWLGWGCKRESSYFRSLEVDITVSASAVMRMDCMHAVMLKPASVHFTFISDYGYLI